MYQFLRLVRKKKTCHILDADGIGTHLFNSFGNVNPVIQCIGITQCVGKSHLCMAAFLVGCLYSGLKVSQIVNTVENTNDINTIRNRLLHKVFYNIIRIRCIAQNVLSSEKHLQLGVFESVAKHSQSFPRIFMKETKGSIKSCTAPAFYGMISDLVHLIDDRQHLPGRHTCCNEGLMRVTQNSFSNLNRFFNYLCHCSVSFLNTISASGCKQQAARQKIKTSKSIRHQTP